LSGFESLFPIHIRSRWAGTRLQNAQAGFDSLYGCRECSYTPPSWNGAVAARRAHTPKAVGSNPTSTTQTESQRRCAIQRQAFEVRVWLVPVQVLACGLRAPCAITIEYMPEECGAQFSALRAERVEYHECCSPRVPPATSVATALGRTGCQPRTAGTLRTVLP
jgi:hypothetical protein